MFYARLDAFRRDGETDSEFSQRLGITRQTFWQYKTGINRPKSHTMQKLCMALGVPEQQFWCGDCLCSTGKQKTTIEDSLVERI